MINAELFICDEKLSMETKHTSTKTAENVNISPNNNISKQRKRQW